MGSSYHVRRPLASRALRPLAALALLSGLCGCSVSMPLTGFVDDHPAAAAADADPGSKKVEVADADRAGPRAQ